MQIALRQPRRTHHHFAGALAIPRTIIHIAIHRAQGHQRQRPPRLHPQRRFALAAQVRSRHLGQRQYRTSLRHPVTGKDINPDPAPCAPDCPSSPNHR
jgi:hypothetical protein